MRVMECNECGETLQAANDEELVRSVGAHMESEHEVEVDKDDLTELVEAEAYEATDS
jgi:predicted small metal-binding protein